MSWLRRNAEAVQAIGTLLTAALAIVALIGVKWQLDGAERISQAQTAREIYRDFVALSLSNPELADPGLCPEFSDKQDIQYDHFVEYMLYTAEQVIEADPEWASTFEGVLEPHTTYFCATSGWNGYSDPVNALIARVRTANCGMLPACAE